jgi:exosome complex RNA-binding protein Rrp42 (RNase PH superfamily)
MKMAEKKSKAPVKTVKDHLKRRTLDEVNQEYTSHAAQLGHMVLLTDNTQEEMKMLKEKMNILFKEANRIKSLEKPVPIPTKPTEQEQAPEKVAASA